MLVACSKERGEEALNNYQSRLENVFERLEFELVSSSQVDDESVPSLPNKVIRETRFDNQASTINLLDFLRLYGCRLQEVVALSNASLGKLAPDSQKLISTLRFIELAPECITSLVENQEQELALQLTSALDQKRDRLDRSIALSVLGGPEYKAFWKMPRALERYPSADLSGESERAFYKLVSMRDTWLSGDVRTDRELFERQLFLISSGDGGALLKATALLLKRMQLLNDLLDSVLASEKLCTARTLYSFDVLANVVQKFFVGDVQVWAAALSKRQYANSTAIASLEGAFFDLLSNDYLSWMKRRDRLFNETRHAVQQHVEKLKILLTQEALKARCSER
ncbi:DUF3080 family protein [Oleiphilus sp. HI0079]|uniref:DUF3080 family protein n=3 Tax=Oleiphilus sp. HI0079 TaxID=1822254 RepID=UPI000AE3BCD1|nr:DUF3080 family protein [Oleiphilus sp. HI0079]